MAKTVRSKENKCKKLCQQLLDQMVILEDKSDEIKKDCLLALIKMADTEVADDMMNYFLRQRREFDDLKQEHKLAVSEKLAVVPAFKKHDAEKQAKAILRMEAVDFEATRLELDYLQQVIVYRDKYVSLDADEIALRSRMTFLMQLFNSYRNSLINKDDDVPAPSLSRCVSAAADVGELFFNDNATTPSMNRYQQKMNNLTSSNLTSSITSNMRPSSSASAPPRLAFFSLFFFLLINDLVVIEL